MAIICPTITAYDAHEYREQVERVTAFAPRIHIDLMDGEFTSTKSPGLESIWWSHYTQADIHLMYKRPMECLEQLIKLRPRMVIIQVEADAHHMHFASELHKENILAGLAILQETPVENTEQIMHSYDHVLIFSGHLGYHGGVVDLGLLDKVKKVRAHHADAEIGWDGGVNVHNALSLVNAGVNVLNVGGFIQKSSDAAAAYAKLIEVTKTSNHDPKTHT